MNFAVKQNGSDLIKDFAFKGETQGVGTSFPAKARWDDRKIESRQRDREHVIWVSWLQQERCRVKWMWRCGGECGVGCGGGVWW